MNGFSSAGAAAQARGRLEPRHRAELQRRVVIEALALGVVERHQQPRDAAQRAFRRRARRRRPAPRHARFRRRRARRGDRRARRGQVVEERAEVDLAGRRLLVLATAARISSTAAA